MLDLPAIAKVDLHRHLEGSLRPATLPELFRAHGQPLPDQGAEALAARTQVGAPLGDLMEVLPPSTSSSAPSSRRRRRSGSPSGLFGWVERALAPRGPC